MASSWLDVTPERLARTEREWRRHAGDAPLAIDETKGLIYARTTELGALRLLRVYRETPYARAYYSPNLDSWIFSLDLDEATVLLSRS